MEKFLCVMKLSKGSAVIGWFKLIVNFICILLILAGLAFSKALKSVLDNAFSDKSKEATEAKFYVLVILVLLGLVVYSVASFILIIGSINHDRVNVLSYLAIDIIVTLLMCWGFYVHFFSFMWLLTLIVQFYLIYTVYAYYRQLSKEFNARLENREHRNRRPKNVGFVRSTTETRQAAEATEII